MQLTGGIVAGPVLLTVPARVNAELRAITDTALVRDFARFFLYVFCVLVALFTMRLYLLQRSRTELLWFSLLLLAHASRTIYTITEYALGPGSMSVYAFITANSLVFGAAVSLELAASLYGFRLPAAARWANGAALTYFSAAALLEFGGATTTILLGALGGYFLALLALILAGIRRRVRDGSGVTIALLLFQFNTALIFFDPSYSAFVPILPPIDTRFTVGPILVSAHHPVILVFIGLMVLLLIRRFARDAVERQRLGEELAAAAEVQSLLLSYTREREECHSAEAVYLPATEVGGDFYWMHNSETGGKIVLLGDVSGKGLKAAMLVASLTGTLRNLRSRRPGEILAELNATLTGNTGGGFVTCCCLHLEPSGQGAAANAGHLAPYLDGREIEVESGLPLGIVPDATYAESSFRLERGSQITLVSDGVVEAADARRELFGFDRTREISTKPAHEIAEAARAWGQNDDITVLTVTRPS